ncbi:unnamed protein product [Penicillium salamii]|nr:unnamed protein product [Penicillium salamii]
MCLVWNPRATARGGSDVMTQAPPPSSSLLSFFNLSFSRFFSLSLSHNSTTSLKMPFTASDICKIIFAIILPPLGVFLERGCGADLLINICLTILGWIPGIIHAIYIIFKY